MGEALLKGLLRSGWAQPGDLVVSEVSEARREHLSSEKALAGVGLVGTAEIPPAEGVVVAVKPTDVEGVCRSLASARPQRVLSIVAGARLADLEAWCGTGVPVIRAMPNTPALVGAAATALSAGSSAGAVDMEWASTLMRSVGTVVEVPEHLMDAVTGVSGSGPAYLFLVVEALTEGGVLVGLPRAVATNLVAQTLLGSARLLVETEESPEALRAAVTSPGGTTAAGLRQLEARGTRAAFVEAVAAAVRRSQELARGLPPV